MRLRGALAGLAAAVALGPAAGRAAARFAVVVGENQGAPGQPRLWFAERDAERFARALTELGDFAAADVILLQGPTLAQVRAALEEVEGRVAAHRARGDHPLLLVYFSGHAGAQGLELGVEQLGFPELRRLVSASSAEARVAIVDACEAGLLTQVKGATADPGLDFPLPADEQVQGTAFVASTAVGEAAQESALLGGSFFTHNLEVGLRGAADADGDGLVTLGEAFRYTAARTLSGTLATEVGGQHATYDFRMSGRGDVVLSDLRRADARLLLPRDPEASYVVRGPGSLLAEVAGGARPITLALPAGRYRVERRAAAGLAIAEVVLERGAAAPLPALAPSRYQLARSKGGPKPGLVFAGGGLFTLGLRGFGAAPAARVGLRKEVGPLGLRLRLDYAAKTVHDRTLGRYDLAYVGGALAALYPLNASRVLVEAGPELGYGHATQRLAASGRAFGSSVLWAGAAAMVTAPFGPVRLGVDAGLGLQAFRLDGHGAVRPAASLSLLALWGF
jgi:hypothetical protein